MITLKELLDLSPNQNEYLIRDNGTEILAFLSDDIAKQYPDLENREVKRIYGYNYKRYSIWYK